MRWLSAAVLLVACAHATAPLQTSHDRYRFEQGTFGPELTITSRFTASSDMTVHLANCNGAIGWGLQRLVDDQWVDAWVAAMDACASAAIEVPPGASRTLTHLVRPRAGAAIDPKGTDIDGVPEGGTYRLILYGANVPLEQRVSNAFTIER